MNEQRIFHGVEYELQLMVETENGLEIVSAPDYLKFQYKLLPREVGFDFENLKIRPPPMTSYKDAVESANYILINKLVPTLIENFKLHKFALFVPNPMCPLFIKEIIEKDSNGVEQIKTEVLPLMDIGCMKHWNISFPFHTPEMKRILNNHFFDYKEIFNKYFELANLSLDKWTYDYKLLKQKGYSILLKDTEDNSKSRIHIKIPYHYSPPQGNPDLLPNFDAAIIPQNKWKSLLCYYKHGVFTKIRDLV